MYLLNDGVDAASSCEIGPRKFAVSSNKSSMNTGLMYHEHGFATVRYIISGREIQGVQQEDDRQSSM